MTEHVCKWKWDIVDNDAWFYCSGCKEPMGALEIEARLNATERLSAEDVVANIAQIEACEFECQGGPIELNTGYIRLRDALRAYADILEGKDETRS